MKEKMKLVREVSLKNVEMLLIASYFIGWETGRRMIDPGHPDMENHLKNLKDILGNIEQVVDGFKKKK